MKKTRRANRKPKRKASAKPKKSATRAQPHPAISFGTDGWRGILARDFTIENATLVARAIARYLVEFEDIRRGVFVAYDTRFAAGRFARHVSEVLTSVGLDVRLAAEPTPTPALSFAVRSNGAAAGVMLTASHNPPPWLGIKLKAAFGGSASPRAHVFVGKQFASLPDFDVDGRVDGVSWARRPRCVVDRARARNTEGDSHAVESDKEPESRDSR
ncbi:MAG: hypothetical protein IH793_11595 [Acidobacteria bacterium]|nr:hypothetical protein [Acidobacteriota bacterium]